MFKGDKCYGKNIKQGKEMRSVDVRKITSISSLVFREALAVVNNLICLNYS